MALYITVRANFEIETDLESWGWLFASSIEGSDCVHMDFIDKCNQFMLRGVGNKVRNEKEKNSIMSRVQEGQKKNSKQCNHHSTIAKTCSFLYATVEQK